MHMNEKIVNRDTNIELLRVISMVMIVLSHLVTHGGFVDLDFSGMLIISLILRLGGKLGVTCFVLISGYYLVSSKFQFQNIVKLYMQILFYAMLCLGIKTIIMDSINVVDVFKTVFAPFYGIYWFPTAYLGLYICFPLLNIVIEKLDDELVKVDIILTVTLSLTTMLLPTSDFLVNNFVWFVYLYFLGATIKKIEYFRQNSKDILLFWGCIVIMWFSSVVMVFVGKRYEISILVSKAYYLSKMESPFMVVAGISLFRLMLNTNIKFNRLINKIGSITFAVYLLHDNELIRSMVWESIFHTRNYYNSKFLIFALYSIFVVFSLFMVSLILEFFRKKIEKIMLQITPIKRICQSMDKWYPFNSLDTLSFISNN